MVITNYIYKKYVVKKHVYKFKNISVLTKIFSIVFARSKYKKQKH